MFNIDKKGYSVEEVDSYLKRLSDDYASVLDTLSKKVDNLEAEIAEKNARISAYKEKYALISKSIYAAVSKAEEVEKEAIERTDREIERLAAFYEKWVSYYDKIVKLYPIDDELAATEKFNRQIERIVISGGLKTKGFGLTQKASEIENSKEDELLYKELVGISSPFDPIEKIKKYYDNKSQEKQSYPPSKGGKAKDKEAAKKERQSKESDYADRSPSGFSFTEALNPKDDLAKIMSELGLLLEDD